MKVFSFTSEPNRPDCPGARELLGLKATSTVRNRSALALWLLPWLFLIGPSWAKENAKDLEALALEDLLNLRLVSANVLGIHHAHPTGEWMVSYQYMRMRMAGNRVGPQRVGVKEVLEQFMVAPTDMDMEMHMVGAMFGATQDLTFMGMIPYLRLSMNHLTRTGQQFTTQSEGLGDVSLSAFYTFYRAERHRFHLDLGASLPTGSIDQRGNTPAGPKQRLPYPMQLGSGTFDPNLGLTYLGQQEDYTWGAHASGTFPLGTNHNDYRIGDQYLVDVWGTYRWNKWLTTSSRTKATFGGDVRGADPRLNPRMVPTADPALRGGKRLDLLIGLNLFMVDGKLFGNRLSAEVAFPLYQSLNGPQLERDWALTLGWQYIWTF